MKKSLLWIALSGVAGCHGRDATWTGLGQRYCEAVSHAVHMTKLLHETAALNVKVVVAGPDRVGACNEAQQALVGAYAERYAASTLGEAVVVLQPAGTHDPGVEITGDFPAGAAYGGTPCGLVTEQNAVEWRTAFEDKWKRHSEDLTRAENACARAWGPGARH